MKAKLTSVDAVVAGLKLIVKLPLVEGSAALAPAATDTDEEFGLAVTVKLSMLIFGREPAEQPVPL